MSIKPRSVPLPIWLSVAVFLLAALAVLYFLAHLLIPAWPPQVGCSAEPCKEAREWIAYSITVLVLLGGLFQYWRAQLWKRAEFVAGQMTSFFSLASVRKATMMIDWAKRRIDLYERPSDDPKTWPLVTRRLQSRALLPHTVVKEVPKIKIDDGAHNTSEYSASSVATDSDLAEFTRAEAAIRDAYDAFFDGVETFASYVRTGLVAPRDLRPYLGYWVEDISSKTDDRDDDLWTCCILSYIDYYGYKGVQELFAAFGRDIKPNGELFAHFLGRVNDDHFGKALTKLWKDAR